MLEDRERFAREQRERHAVVGRRAGRARRDAVRRDARGDRRRRLGRGRRRRRLAPARRSARAGRRARATAGHRSDRQWTSAARATSRGCARCCRRELEVGQLGADQAARRGERAARPRLPPPPARRRRPRTATTTARSCCGSSRRTSRRARSARRAPMPRARGARVPVEPRLAHRQVGLGGRGRAEPAGAARARPSRDDSDFDDASARGHGRSSLTAASKVRRSCAASTSRRAAGDDGASSERCRRSACPRRPASCRRPRSRRRA